MAEYVVIDKEQLESDLTAVADSIRTKGKTTEALNFPEGFKSAVDSIKNVGIILSDFTGSYNLPKIANMRSLSGIDWSYAYEMSVIRLFDSLFANVNGNPNGGFFVLLEEVYLFDGLQIISTNMFKNCTKLHTIHGDLPSIKRISDNAFYGCKSFAKFPYMPNLERIDTNTFNGCIGLTEIKLPDTITSIASNSFSGCDNITDIYCPWAEGAIANAPWGATNATIHYNTQYDENGNPITA